MKYTEENIKKLEQIYDIMMSLQNTETEEEKISKVQQAGQLLYDIGMVKNPNNVKEVTQVYSTYLLEQIRAYVKKSQNEVKKNGQR